MAIAQEKPNFGDLRGHMNAKAVILSANIYCNQSIGDMPKYIDYLDSEIATLVASNTTEQQFFHANMSVAMTNASTAVQSLGCDSFLGAAIQKMNVIYDYLEAK